MKPRHSPCLATPVLLVALLTALPARAAEEPAPNADRRGLQLTAQGDARQQHSVTAAASLPIGRHAWVQAGVGRSRSLGGDAAAASRARQATLGGGIAGRRWQLALNASERRDGSALRQHDVAATLDMQPAEGVNVGLDLAQRRARAQRGAEQQRQRGRGVGVHAALALTPRIGVHGAVMRNHYRTTTTAPAAAPGGLLGGVPLLQPARLSAVNRDEAALARSDQLGASWRVAEGVALQGEWLQDRLEQGGRLRSLQLKAAVSAGGGWTLTPGIGHSRGPDGTGAAYGAFAAHYAW